MWPVFRRRLLLVVLREVRWDGLASSFDLVLDEEAIVSVVDREGGGRSIMRSSGDDRRERTQDG